MKKCTKCKAGDLEINRVGTDSFGDFDDTVTVKCGHCSARYETDLDTLGMAEELWVIAAILAFQTAIESGPTL